MKAKLELNLAMELFHEAFEHQMRGDYESAIRLYQQSIGTCPTAEAHTFLGWTYSFQGKLEDAIAECKRAIEIDPDFGNPYNDIGAYLFEEEKYEEAIPWLEKAIQAKRYDARHYPHYNLGRIYLVQDLLNRAQEEFEKALVISPEYSQAHQALEAARRRIN
ncbi:MAG: tetratricopeptide repeat protein [Acidobacteria bacterium]|nr:tetratricopeptide repeat protein [Acidobacteriota bacterium]MBI3655955.1 tetratricopeptide repeat protein [Acidobacteriota bacterium]